MYKRISENSILDLQNLKDIFHEQLYESISFIYIFNETLLNIFSQQNDLREYHELLFFVINITIRWF